MHDVIVIGGGVVGLAVAREVSRKRSVLLLDKGEVGEGTSWAAAGMLSPQSEADDDGPFFQLCMSSLQMFEEFAVGLKSETGIETEHHRSGLLTLASSSDELSVLRSRVDRQSATGLQAQLLEPRNVLSIEPQITAKFAGAMYLPEDQQVSPRKLTKALAASCRRRGVEILSGTAVNAVVAEKGRCIGVLTSGCTIRAGCVIVASGVWSGAIDGLSPKIPVYPRKGQILSLDMPTGAFRNMIRWRHSYFVPRPEGELVVGATNEDVGFDRSLTPAGISRLLVDAQEISSHVGSYPIRETWSGLRPATPDDLPVLGLSGIENLLYATGHYRNGILLSPITASIVAALIDRVPPPNRIEPFSPMRFERTGKLGDSNSGKRDV